MDIVERLRRLNRQLGDEAADEIERLRLALAYRRRAVEADNDLYEGADEIERLRLALACRRRSVEDCVLCCGERPAGSTGSTIGVVLVHEGGVREATRILCPRCGGIGKEGGGR